MTLEDRIQAAVAVAERYAQIDGSRHRLWVINQMVKALLGEEGYTAWLADMSSDPEYGEWDEGIAP